MRRSGNRERGFLGQSHILRLGRGGDPGELGRGRTLVVKFQVLVVCSDSRIKHLMFLIESNL